jgi:ATP-dependent Clp protease ATP-binding subunit ClpC
MAKLTYADFDRDAVLAMQLANQSAGMLNHDYIDSEHILMGLCRSSCASVTATLSHYGVSAGQIIDRLKGRVQRGPSPVDSGKRTPQPKAMRVTQHAADIASRLDVAAVGANHLLLGMLFVDDSIAHEVLKSVGLNYDDTLRYIEKS